MTTDLSPEELSQMTKEDYEKVFTQFVTSLLGDFSRYLDNCDSEKIDIVADGLKFGKIQLYLSEAEFEALLAKVYGAIESVLTVKRQTFGVVYRAYVLLADERQSKNDEARFSNGRFPPSFGTGYWLLEAS